MGGLGGVLGGYGRIRGDMGVLGGYWGDMQEMGGVGLWGVGPWGVGPWGVRVWGVGQWGSAGTAPKPPTHHSGEDVCVEGGGHAEL